MTRTGIERLAIRAGRSVRQRPVAAALIAGIAIGGTAVAAPTETVLHRYAGVAEGWDPEAPLVMDGSGNLYGTTYYGGTGAAAVDGGLGAGTVFRLAPPAPGGKGWRYTALHRFGTTEHGWNPGGLLLDRSTGTLYGTTSYGGRGVRSNNDGFGTAFALTPPSAGGSEYGFRALYRFGEPTTDAAVPASPLIFGPNGMLYGVSAEGIGPKWGWGTVYRLTPSGRANTLGSEQVVDNFAFNGWIHLTSATGAALVMDSSGALYGTNMFESWNGGQCNVATCGSVFKLTPPSGKETSWKETVVYAFEGQAGGSIVPASPPLPDGKGNLYVSTQIGGDYYVGAVFKLTPPSGSQTLWNGTQIYSFKVNFDNIINDDGHYPVGPLAIDAAGAVYGATKEGGKSSGNGFGTVFKLTPPASGTTWKETVLHSFRGGLDGATPSGGVILDAGGTIYGATAAGGANKPNPNGSQGFGTIYQIVH